MLINNILQWSGTVCLIAMYVVMSFFPTLHPVNIMLGLAGGSFYFVWSVRTYNRPQQFVNLAGITVCVAGLLKYYI